MSTGPHLLSARGISKTFAGRKVLRDVAMDMAPGEVRGLIGQNGSGKSTFIKILAGYQAPDEGGMLSVRGEAVTLPLRPGDPPRLGFAFVHQDLGLIPSETVLENFLLAGFAHRAAYRIPWASERRRAAAALAEFGLDVPLSVPVHSLPEVERAMLAIVRAVSQLRHHDSGLLVLDEPTAYLPRDGIDRLFAVVREVAAAGFAVLFVTHRLDEVWAITDRVSILRDGVLVTDEPTARLDEASLMRALLGFSLDELYPQAPAHGDRESVLAVTGLSGEGLHDVGLHAARGEIVGLTGLLGMGWERVPYLLFGAGSGASGTMTVEATPIDVATLTPRRAMASGFALLPADRQRKSAIGEASVLENATLTTLSTYFRAGRLRRRTETEAVRQLLEDFDVRPRDPAQQLATLSGGNQQKVLLAKWFESAPRVLLLHEPTQGIDIGAKKQVFARIRTAADEGAAVVIASAEYEDLAHLCDRVLVFRNGRVVSELRGSSLTEERIVEQCFRERVEGTVDTRPQLVGGT